MKLSYNSRKHKYLLFTPGPVNVAENELRKSQHLLTCLDERIWKIPNYPLAIQIQDVILHELFSHHLVEERWLKRHKTRDM